MKQQSLASKMTYGRPIPLDRIVAQIGERAQTNTQHYGKRPYGVGLLVAGVDDGGPHLFEFQPSGMTQEMVACAIGARSQMARTYLERHLGDFEDASRADLIKHGLRALKESLSQDKELTVENTSVAVIGAKSAEHRKGENFVLFDEAQVGTWLEGAFDSSEPATDAGSGPAETGASAMEVDS